METELQLAIGYIDTFAGNGKARSTGDGKRAVKAGIPLPHHVALDKEERWLYFAESGSDRVRRVNLTEGTVHNFAGIGETCYSGDKGLCGEAGLYLPLDMACDSNNDLYICDSGSNRIRKVDHETGIITTVVGTGEHGFNGDGHALEVNLTWPAAIAFDKDDVMYIADTQSHRIRRYRFPDRSRSRPSAGNWTVRTTHASNRWSHGTWWSCPAMPSELISAMTMDGSCRCVRMGSICPSIWTMGGRRWTRVCMTSSGLRSTGLEMSI